MLCGGHSWCYHFTPLCLFHTSKVSIAVHKRCGLGHLSALLYSSHHYLGNLSRLTLVLLPIALEDYASILSPTPPHPCPAPRPAPHPSRISCNPSFARLCMLIRCRSGCYSNKHVLINYLHLGYHDLQCA